MLSSLFFFNDTATTEIYTLSLHDALPISPARTSSTPASTRSSMSGRSSPSTSATTSRVCSTGQTSRTSSRPGRSEEHTSELQSHLNLVCRLLLEKKKDFMTRFLYHTES